MIRTSASRVWISPNRSEEMIYDLNLISFDISLIKVINMRNSPASLECWHPRALQLQSVSCIPGQVERVYPSEPSQSIEQTQTCPCRKTPAACWENDTCINLQKNMTWMEINALNLTIELRTLVEEAQSQMSIHTCCQDEEWLNHLCLWENKIIILVLDSSKRSSKHETKKPHLKAKESPHYECDFTFTSVLIWHDVQNYYHMINICNMVVV